MADIVNVRTSAQGREYVDLMNEHLRCRALPVVPDLEQAEVEEMPSRWLHHQNWFLAGEAN